MANFSSSIGTCFVRGVLWLVVAALACRSAPAWSAPAPEPPGHRANDEEMEVAYLLKRGTAESLATAALLAHLVETQTPRLPKPDPEALMTRAVAMAPDRPELVWLQLRECEMRSCARLPALATRLRALDPGNGVALLPEFRGAKAQDPAEATRLIAAMGESERVNLYWNTLLAMMFDALTHDAQAPIAATALTRGADDRLSHAAGVLLAVDTAPFNALARLCRPEQFVEAGRRTACEHLMPRLEASDAFVTQSLALSLQASWFGADGPSRERIVAKQRQLVYLLQASGRDRGSLADADAERRVAAMRRLPREQDVAEAMLESFNEPLQRPENWSGG